ncbi:MAG: serine hydroxymethyltransferase [Candidatus Omnitrophica bacterium]|nr:serine hydroxymethyltransferase [Candidatus Omnitrophota bacterium]
MNLLKKKDAEIYKAIIGETKRQNNNIELIASENFVDEAVLQAQGSVMTNKYAEGYPAKRWYAGCEYVDVAENLAIERAKKLFHAEHANMQPHSGSSANMAVFFSQLKFGDTVLAMDIACGGHLTHGHKLNFSGKYYNMVFYGVDKQTEMIDCTEVAALARQHKPKMILAGASAYPRIIDFKKFKEIADETGALLMVDMAHIAGLVAAGLHPNPVPYADFVTSTAHKTLCGPRSGFILCKEKYAKSIDITVFPGLQGGPLMHVIAAKAVAFKNASSAEFKKKQVQTIKNAKALADELKKRNYRIVSGGTDNHLLLVDLVKSRNVTGKDAAAALDKAGITVNKNLIPHDPNPPLVASGIRLGTPAVTTRGMKEPQMRQIASFIDEVLSDINNEKTIAQVRKKVLLFVKKFPIYKERLK